MDGPALDAGMLAERRTDRQNSSCHWNGPGSGPAQIIPVQDPEPGPLLGQLLSMGLLAGGWAEEGGWGAPGLLHALGHRQ